MDADNKKTLRSLLDSYKLEDVRDEIDELQRDVDSMTMQIKGLRELERIIAARDGVTLEKPQAVARAPRKAKTEEKRHTAENLGDPSPKVEESISSKIMSAVRIYGASTAKQLADRCELEMSQVYHREWMLR